MAPDLAGRSHVLGARPFGMQRCRRPLLLPFGLALLASLETEAVRFRRIKQTPAVTAAASSASSSSQAQFAVGDSPAMGPNPPPQRAGQFALRGLGFSGGVDSAGAPELPEYLPIYFDDGGSNISNFGEQPAGDHHSRPATTTGSSHRLARRWVRVVPPAVEGTGVLPPPPAGRAANNESTTSAAVASSAVIPTTAPPAGPVWTTTTGPPTVVPPGGAAQTPGAPHATPTAPPIQAGTPPSNGSKVGPAVPAPVIQKKFCNEANTIWDLGFYDGADSASYLSGGYCVVAVEADPQLVESAVTGAFATYIATGQLRLVNVAVAPASEPGVIPPAFLVFYKSHCTKEWNSFDQKVGCRSCVPPHELDTTTCTMVQVRATACAHIFAEFGRPHYLKLDIEGAETGCFEAMQQLKESGSPVLGTTPGSLDALPDFVSAEISGPGYIDALHALGYTQFKLVRQDVLWHDGHSTTGPWGWNALDCRTAAAWRAYPEARAEMVRIGQKPVLANLNHTKANMNETKEMQVATQNATADPCPQEGIGTVWYDVHVMK